MSAERKLGGNGDLATYEPAEAVQRPWFEWVCPDCPDWACGGVDEGGVAEGKRLHRRTTHDGVTFREAIREYWATQATPEATSQAVARPMHREAD